MRKTILKITVIVFTVLVFSGVSFFYHSMEGVLAKEAIFTSEDSGKVATYPVGAMLTVILNQYIFPQSQWHISCFPSNILQKTGTAHFLFPPLYGEKYTGVNAGICYVKNNSFVVTIRLINFPS